VFLFSLDGRVSAAVAQPKEGPVHDFAWSPTDPAQFVCIAGKSPPQAALFSLPKGEATFSFGTGPFNTVKWQPQGRLVLLGGFGNMSGDVQVWDARRCKPASPPFSTVSVATQLEWAPDGRTLVAATCKPRLNVDNGYRLWTYHGRLLTHVPLESLYDAAWRPAPAPGAFPDRPPSPFAGKAAAAAAAAGGAASSAASAAAAPSAAALAAASSAVPGLAAPPAPAAVAASVAGALGSGKAGAYVPPHLRGTGAASTVTALMKEGHRKAERLGPAAAAAAAAAPAPVSVVPGMDPADAGKKKRRRRKKAAAGGAGGGDEGEGEDGGED